MAGTAVNVSLTSRWDYVMPIDLMTAEQLTDVREALECLLDLDICTEEERECLLGLDQRIDRQIKIRGIYP